MDEVKLLISNRKVDILCVSETWLLPNIPNQFIDISNYNIFRYDQGHGGGTCIYVREDLVVTSINFDIPRTDGVEDIWLNVQCRKLPSIIIGSIYRHPHSSNSTFDYLLDVFRSVCIRNKPIFILGDLNDDLLTPNSKLSKILKTTKLCQLINNPTRITPRSSTLLDVIITNKTSMVISSDVTPCEIADHELISVHVNIRKPKRQPEIKTFRSLKHYSQDMFCNSILDNVPNLNIILETDDVNRQVEVFNNVFNTCLNECAPVVTKEIRRPYAPWITDDIHSAMDVRNDLQKRLKKDRYNILLQDEYKREKKRVKSLIHNSKSNYTKEKIHNCKGNTKDTWKVIKKIIPNRPNTKQCIFEDSNLKANEFNDFFANVGRNTHEKAQEMLNDDETLDILPFTQIIDANMQPFRPQPVTVETVILTVKDLNNSNSFGSDGIPTRFIKDSLFVIAFYVTVIINTSIVTGIYPTIWKYSHVTPLLKNGDINDPSNFRPISLLSILSKVLEKIVAGQLVLHLENKKLLSNTQHGFRRNLSTETALMKVTEEIYKNMDNREISLLILCDLSKAFDSVSHEVLIRKCSELYIDKFWFQDYLKDRTQSVCIDNITSTVTNVKYGVPQGSILGPILFLIYVNDISTIMDDCKLIQYADDSQFVLSDDIENLPELVKKAEHLLSKVKNYFCNIGLLMNAKKTQCMFIGTHQNISRVPDDIRIKCGNENIVPCHHVKNLGVHMDRHLTFDVHIDEVCKKVTGILMYISRMSGNFDTQTRTQIVQALALSTINYCSKIWGMANNTQIQRVQKLQNFAAKVAIGGARKYDHVTPIISKLKWLKIKEKCEYDICIAVFNVLRRNLPEWLFTFPTVNQALEHSIITRQGNYLFVQRTKTDIGLRSFKIKGPLLWNQLPKYLTDIVNSNAFKIRLKHYYLMKE